MGLREWSLVSRTRYALVSTGVNAVVVLGLTAVGGSLSVRHLLLWIPLVLLSLLAHGWIWYPRAKETDASPRVSRAGR